MFRLISILSPLLPLTIGRHKRANLLWWLLLASLVTDVASYIIKDRIGKSFSLPGNLFAMTEFLLILFFYKKTVFQRKGIFYTLLCGSLLLFIVSTTLLKGWLQLNRLGISGFLLIYIALSISGFYTMLRQQKILFLERSSFFWSNVAILIYASGAFFLFLFTSHIRNSADKVTLTQLWYTLFLSLNILKNILLSIALSKKGES